MTPGHRIPPALPALLLLLSLAGCADTPGTYAPPVERRPVSGYPAHLLSMVGMGDPAADAYIVRGISPAAESGGWRWTSRRPELRFAILTTKDPTLVMEFAVPRETFAVTGPVTISVFVNDRLLEAVRCGEPGRKRFEKRVPADWLRPDAMTTVAAEIDRVYKSPQDGAELGFILSRVGFTP